MSYLIEWVKYFLEVLCFIMSMDSISLVGTVT